MVCVSDRVWLSKHCRELVDSVIRMSKAQQQQQKKWAKDLNRHLTSADKQMADTLEKVPMLPGGCKLKLTSIMTGHIAHVLTGLTLYESHLASTTHMASRCCCWTNWTICVSDVFSWMWSWIFRLKPKVKHGHWLSYICHMSHIWNWQETNE